MRPLEIYDQRAPTVCIERHSGELHCSNRQNTIKLETRNKLEPELVKRDRQLLIKRNHQRRVPGRICILRLREFAGPITDLQRFVYKLAQVPVTHRRQTVS